MSQPLASQTIPAEGAVLQSWMAEWPDEVRKAWLDWLQQIRPYLDRCTSASRTLEQTEPAGYDGIRSRGTFDQLLLSEWAVLLEEPDEFIRRYDQQELLYFQPDLDSSATVQHTLIVLSHDVRLVGWPRLAQLALWMALIERAQSRQQQVWFNTTHRPQRVRDASDVQNAYRWLAHPIAAFCDNTALHDWWQNPSNNRSLPRHWDEVWEIGFPTDWPLLDPQRSRRIALQHRPFDRQIGLHFQNGLQLTGSLHLAYLPESIALDILQIASPSTTEYSDLTSQRYHPQWPIVVSPDGRLVVITQENGRQADIFRRLSEHQYKLERRISWPVNREPLAFRIDEAGYLTAILTELPVRDAEAIASCPQALNLTITSTTPLWYWYEKQGSVPCCLEASIEQIALRVWPDLVEQNGSLQIILENERFEIQGQYISQLPSQSKCRYFVLQDDILEIVINHDSPDEDSALDIKLNTHSSLPKEWTVKTGLSADEIGNLVQNENGRLVLAGRNLREGVPYSTVLILGSNGKSKLLNYFAPEPDPIIRILTCNDSSKIMITLAENKLSISVHSIDLDYQQLISLGIDQVVTLKAALEQWYFTNLYYLLLLENGELMHGRVVNGTLDIPKQVEL